jgi:hypothetical protein
MSYILDALEKGEKEKGIAQVPTLSTVHDLRTKSPIRLWIASGIVILCIAAFSWFFFFGMNANNEVTPSLAQGVGGDLNHPKLEPLKPPASVVESSFVSSPPESLETPGSGYFRKIASRADETEMGMPPRVRQEPIIDKRNVARSNGATMFPRQDEDASKSSSHEPMKLRPPQPKMAAAKAEGPKPAVNVTGEGQVSLREAIDKMTMSVLFYTENEAERLVFVNGRKYVEGDKIEGKYLLEAITSEGAILSYEGKRAVLRPKPN